MAIKVQGRVLDPTTDAPDAKLLPRKMAPGRPRFVLGHLPQRWDFDDATGQFLPSLSTLCFSPGVQGARALRDGPDGRPRMDTSAVKNHFNAKDGVIINPGDKRLGEYGAYQQTAENDAGAIINCSIFESWDVIGQEVWWEHNTDEYRKFRQLLISEGVIEQINPRIRQKKIDLQTRDIHELQRRYGASPSHEGLRSELGHAVARLRAMQDGIPLADADALIRAEGRQVAPVEVDTPKPAAVQSTARTIDDELADARAYLSDMKVEHPDIYKKVVGKKRPDISGINKVREFVEGIETAVEAQA